jgi:6-phosphogluconolactonase
MRELVICETPDDVADAAADLIFESQQLAIEERGVFRIALAGGRTPDLLYERLASEEWKNQMAWEQWEVFWGDERAVPRNDAASNYGNAEKVFLKKVPLGDIWPMACDSGDLSAAAADYARLLKSRFGPGLPEFDLILLGLGPDGHTASLFPDHAALQSEALVEAVHVDLPVPRRLTLTIPVLNRARRVIFLVTGSEKAESALRILKETDPELPAARVVPEEGDCWWLLDLEAAHLIR